MALTLLHLFKAVREMASFWEGQKRHCDFLPGLERLCLNRELRRSGLSSSFWVGLCLSDLTQFTENSSNVGGSKPLPDNEFLL